MKTASAPLIAHLTAGQQFRRAELWTFTLESGEIKRFTTLDVDVTVGADTWSADCPGLTRPRSRLVAGIEVDEFEVTVEPGADDLIGGLPWVQAARRKLLRRGRLSIERAYMPAWGDTSFGKLWVMGGEIGDVSGTPAELRLTIASDLKYLDKSLPVDVVQPPCRYTTFDGNCGLSAAAFKVTGTLSAGSTVSTLLAVLAQASGWFSLGRIVFTSGANAGHSRFIKRHTAGAPATLVLVTPLHNAPSAGDAFDLYPGDDHTLQTCRDKFNNLLNFGGEPFVPRPETAV